MLPQNIISFCNPFFSYCIDHWHYSYHIHWKKVGIANNFHAPSEELQYPYQSHYRALALWAELLNKNGDYRGDSILNNVSSSPTTTFVTFNVRLTDPKPLFEIKSRAYILLFTIIHSTKYITLQELQCNSHLTKYFLPFTVQVNMFSKTI